MTTTKRPTQKKREPRGKPLGRPLKRPNLATRSAPPDKGKPLTVEQRSYMLDCLAKGWPTAVVRDAIRKAGGPDVSGKVVRDAFRRSAEEIEIRRERWLAKLRGEPLATDRDRVRELRHLYAQMVAAELREMCPVCLGGGVVVSTDKKITGRRGGKPKPKTSRCENCQGRRYILPPQAQEAIAALEGDVRLDTLIRLLGKLPPGSPKLNERAAELLRQIREEAGDAWSPRERGVVPEAGDQGGGRHLHFHGKEAVEAALTGLRRVLEATPEQIVAACEAEAAELVKAAEETAP